ncbi:MAG: hypothetical protein HWE30_04250 [Methylocystaceae bacterium]|nr:hypothetical protein [Methylocystaceae bacterium]
MDTPQLVILNILLLTSASVFLIVIRNRSMKGWGLAYWSLAFCLFSLGLSFCFLPNVSDINIRFNITQVNLTIFLGYYFLWVGCLYFFNDSRKYKKRSLPYIVLFYLAINIILDDYIAVHELISINYLLHGTLSSMLAYIFFSYDDQTHFSSLALGILFGFQAFMRFVFSLVCWLDTQRVTILSPGEFSFYDFLTITLFIFTATPFFVLQLFDKKFNRISK